MYLSSKTLCTAWRLTAVCVCVCFLPVVASGFVGFLLNTEHEQRRNVLDDFSWGVLLPSWSRLSCDVIG